MSVDLDRQLSEYCRHLDEKQGALSFDDILERSGDLQVIPGRTTQHLSSRRRWIAIAAAAVAILIVAIGIRLVPSDGSPELVVQPTTTSINPPTTSTTNIDRIPPLAAQGWPDTSENAAGVYSWDGSRCAGSSCNVGFMHNGYGSGDVDILFEVAPERSITDDGATPVTVAEHAGIHRRIDATREEWIVDIEGTTIAIRLIANYGTSQSDLDEARAIIDSIRTEPVDNDLGFRLVFTLSTDDWDSG